MKPRAVGFKERRNAVTEYLKEQPRGYKASIPELSEEVFGKTVNNSKDKDYIAISNAIDAEPRVDPAQTRDGMYREYKLNSKVRRE